LGNEFNGVHSIDSTEFSVKSADQLLPVDITLHPIYRPDGMMLVNRYTTLLPFMLNQIQKHIKQDMPIPIIVASSEEMLNNFINNEIYSNPEFVLILDNVIRASTHCYSVPLSIEEYVDDRVDLKESLKAIAKLKAKLADEENSNTAKETELGNSDSRKETVDRYSILGKITSSASIWSSFEMRLTSLTLQNNAKSIKKKFLNIINEDNTLMELSFKMTLYDDLLLVHGVNTACISIALGIVLGMTDEDLINLAITSMFCNVGFIRIPKADFHEYLKGTITEELISEHIRGSLEIIASAPKCRNKSIVFGILEHHEYFDGSGRPTGKRGKDINLFARILSIALKYESYINEFYHGNLANLNNIEKMIFKNKDNKFDPEILAAYMRNSCAFR
jgi:HD-GYP domain-containing protein (c-di-GMP phosphodiesterase class II)